MSDLAVDALAVWRLTRLVTSDEITSKQRNRILVSFGPSHPVSYLVTCPPCAGVWVAAGVTVARACFPRAWRSASRMLALAAVVCFAEAGLASLERQ